MMVIQPTRRSLLLVCVLDGLAYRCMLWPGSSINHISLLNKLIAKVMLESLTRNDARREEYKSHIN